MARPRLVGTLQVLAAIGIIVAASVGQTKAGAGDFSDEASNATLRCAECSEIGCWTAPLVTECEPGHNYTFCASHVIDHADGTRNLAKGCATADDCEADYVNRTRGVSKCNEVNRQVTGLDLDCFFCCKGDNCNAGPEIIPPDDTLITEADLTSASDEELE